MEDEDEEGGVRRGGGGWEIIVFFKTKLDSEEIEECNGVSREDGGEGGLLCFWEDKERILRRSLQLKDVVG